MSPRWLASVAALLVAACAARSGGDEATATGLEGHAFAFADGGFFDSALAGTPVELIFGRTHDSGRGVFVLVAPAVIGTDTGPARVEGRFRQRPWEFRIASSSFDAGLFAGLRAGARVRMTSCSVDPVDARLTLASATGRASSAPPERRPSIVVVLSDDQRWDTLFALPLTTDRLADRLVTFSNAYQTTPVCGPSRAGFLAGGFYAYDTGVRTHGRWNGGIERFDDTHTLATALQRSGYRTGFVGKYVNGYGAVAPYVPPGWSHFLALRSEDDWSQFSVVRGASTALPAHGTSIGPIADYLTDYQTARAVDFLETHGDYPFFLFFSPNAPHRPATPAAADEASFGGFLYRDRGYGELDRSDKPLWVRETGPFNEASHDEFHRDQLRSLQALDRAVVQLVDAVERLGKLDDTLFLFTSDNGLQWGEHGLTGKGKPYEESVRVPLFACVPGVAPRQDERLVAVNLDVPATVLDLAGVDAATRGRSLLPLLAGEARGWREELLLESAGEASGEAFVWAGLRVQRGVQEWKYVEYPTGERELYDLVGDPFEEENARAAYPDVVAELADLLAPLKGLTIVTTELPPAQLGQPYAAPIDTWGAQPPLEWSLTDGELPEGLLLDPSSGVIAGTPARAEDVSFVVEVVGRAVAAHTGARQRFAQPLKLSVQP